MSSPLTPADIDALKQRRWFGPNSHLIRRLLSTVDAAWSDKMAPQPEPDVSGCEKYTENVVLVVYQDGTCELFGRDYVRCHVVEVPPIDTTDEEALWWLDRALPKWAQRLIQEGRQVAYGQPATRPMSAMYVRRLAHDAVDAAMESHDTEAHN